MSKFMHKWPLAYVDFKQLSCFPSQHSSPVQYRGVWPAAHFAGQKKSVTPQTACHGWLQGLLNTMWGKVRETWRAQRSRSNISAIYSNRSFICWLSRVYKFFWVDCMYTEYNYLQVQQKHVTFVLSRKFACFQHVWCRLYFWKVSGSLGKISLLKS